MYLTDAASACNQVGRDEPLRAEPSQPDRPVAGRHRDRRASMTAPLRA